MNCKVIRKRKKRIIRFTKNGGNIKKATICHIRDIISGHYVKPETVVNENSIDVIVTSKHNTKLDYIVRLVEAVLLPNSSRLFDCADCKIRKRPFFCTYKKTP